MTASVRERLLAAALALFATATSLLIATVVFDRIPHVTDGVSYLFQAKIFAAGRLYLEAPPAPLLFAHENVVLDPQRWCSLYPPGWPLLLALGELAGAAWMVGPLLLGLAVLGVWRLGRALFDPPTGLLAAAALAVSPFALITGADFMAHVPALAAAVWCLAFLASGCAAERPGRPLTAAGLAGGLGLLIRPFTTLVLLAPAVVWVLLRLRRDRRWLRALGWLALGVLPGVAAFLLYNHLVFGGFLRSGYQAYSARRFGSVGSMSATPAEALATNLPWFWLNLNRSLWGFPWPDLLLLLPLLWPRPGRSRDVMLAACAGSLLLAYSFYFYHDVIDSGPRFVFETVGPLAVLAARSLRLLYAGAVRLADRRAAPPSRRLARLAAVGLGTALLLLFPLGLRLPSQMIRLSGWYLGVSAEPLRRAAAAGVGPEALVFVAGTPWCYSGLFLANGIPPGGGPRVFVRDIPPLRAAALDLYPRREVWEVRVVVEMVYRDIARPVEVTWTRLR